MKGWPIFVAGLLLGAVGGMLLGGSKGSGKGKNAEAGARRNGNGAGQAAYSPGRGPGGKATRPGRRGKGGGRSAGGVNSPAQVEDLIDYLQGLATVDDFEEVNFMQLLRHGSFVAQMSEREIKAALQSLQQREAENPGREDDGEFMQIFSALLFARYAELNGREAMQLAVNGGFGKRWEGDEDELIPIGMSSWVGADPGGAAAWFRGEGVSDPKFAELLEDRTVQNAFFAAMARHDTKIAMELALEAGEEVAEDSMEVIARYEKTVEGLVGMLQSSKGEARSDVFQVLSERDPTAAAGWLEGQEGLEDRDRYVEAVADSFLDRDEAAGIEWYMAQEVTENGKAERYHDIAIKMAQSDPAAASEWLGNQEDTPARDRAEANLARQIARRRDWKTSFEWAAQVANPGERKQTVDWILRRGWDRRAGTIDGGTAEAAREAGFGEELEAYLQANSRKGGGEVLR